MSLVPVRISGVVRDYDWGEIDGLTLWVEDAPSGPQAELWFGSHRTAPSPLVDDDTRTLRDAWEGHSAPILTKILAAGTPLSLQVHPTAELAERMWADDETAQLLSDRAEKTEMLIALEPFLILSGWRPMADSVRLMEAIGADASVIEALQRGDRDEAVRLLLGSCPIRADEVQWLEAVATAGLDEFAAPALAAVTDKFASDAGVGVAALLQSELLRAGDAAYVPAGVPHGYVHGLGVEVMKSSDNVLRLGLTSKQMSVDSALEAIVPGAEPLIIRRPADRVYAPQGCPFGVRMLTDGEAPTADDCYRLVLCLDGSTEVHFGHRGYRLDPGQALAIPETAESARVVATGSAVVVSAISAG